MRKITIFWKGILIGIALVLPGLSGSLMAVLLGIYEELVEKISARSRKLSEGLPFLTGVGIGILLSARLVLHLCVRFPFQSNLFFLGLVAGGLPGLFRIRKTAPPGLRNGILLTAAFAAVFALSFVTEPSGDFQAAITRIYGAKEVLILCGTGLVSCMLMMLPGVSGSVVLLLLGQYGTVYGAAAALTSLQTAEWLPALAVGAVFAVGAGAGIYLASRLLHRALSRNETAVRWMIIGLTAGTCAAIGRIAVRMLEEGRTELSGIPMLVSSAAALLLGFCATLFLEKKDNREKNY